jgi:hypothetical protein
VSSAHVAAAVAIAAAGAVVLAVPQIAGIDTWKWVLGAIGLALVIKAGRRTR